MFLMKTQILTRNFILILFIDIMSWISRRHYNRT